MSPDVKFLLMCLGFSFICALIKQIYDTRYLPKKSVYVFIIDVIISGISGIVTTLLLFDTIKNKITLMGISGIAGMFGLNAIKMLMKFQLGKKINIQIGMEEDDDGSLEIFECDVSPNNQNIKCKKKENKKTKDEESGQ